MKQYPTQGRLRMAGAGLRMSGLAITLIAIVLSACAVTPDLKRLYAVSSADRRQNPVILVHGVFGSKLREKNGKEIWPGSFTRFLFGGLETLSLKIDPDTLAAEPGDSEAYALFDGVAANRYLVRIRRTLEEAGGYSFAEAGTPSRPNEQRYYVFIYDWRRDLVQSAARLDKLVEQIRRDYNDPDLKVDIVAHSMGAILTRYFLRYGSEDVLGSDTFEPTQVGAAKIRKVVLIAAPNMGSITGLQIFMKGRRFGGVVLHPEILATMPSAYQVLPDPDRDWMITRDGKRLNRDLYSIDTWRDFRWSVFDPRVRRRIRRRFDTKSDADQYLAVLERYFEKNLIRAKRFHRALSLPLRRTSVRYVVFGGDCTLTPARCLIERVNGQAKIRLFPDQIENPMPGVDYTKLMLEPGDGRVTKPSLLARNALDPSAPVKEPGAFPLAYSVFLCATHTGLTADITFQDNLLNILLTQTTTEDRI